LTPQVGNGLGNAPNKDPLACDRTGAPRRDEKGRRRRQRWHRIWQPIERRASRERCGQKGDFYRHFV
jgi:hypothetical protein